MSINDASTGNKTSLIGELSETEGAQVITQQEQMVLRTDINQNNFIRSEHFYPTSNHYVKGIKRLLPNHILCYHVKVLQEYAKRLISPIHILSDMELVHHEIDESHIKKDNCVCHRTEVILKYDILNDFVHKYSYVFI